MRKSEKYLCTIIIPLIIVILVILIKIVPTVISRYLNNFFRIIPNSSKLGIHFLFYASSLDIFIITYFIVFVKRLLDLILKSSRQNEFGINLNTNQIVLKFVSKNLT